MMMEPINLRRLDVIAVRSSTEAVCFDTHLCLADYRDYVFVGLLDYQMESGFGFCIDPFEGDVWDALGETWLGDLEIEPSLADPIEIRLVAERHGTSFIPLLKIQGRSYPAPAILFDRPQLCAVVGTVTREGGARFSNSLIYSWDSETIVVA